MNASPFTVMFSFIFTAFAISVAAGVPPSVGEVINAFVERATDDRATDQRVRIRRDKTSGPGSVTERTAEEDNKLVDECPSEYGSEVLYELIRDPNTRQCNYEKRSGQVLRAVKGDDITRRQYRLLKRAPCSTEATCMKACDRIQCAFFIRNIKERPGYAYFYSWDETTSHGGHYSPSTVFTSYIRDCQSGTAFQVRQLSKRQARIAGSPAKGGGASRPKSGERKSPKSGERNPPKSGERKPSRPATPSPSKLGTRSPSKPGAPGKARPAAAKPLDPAFNNFRKRHGRRYSSPEETGYRDDVFRQNRRRVAQLNSYVLAKGGAPCGETRFMDLTHEEFLRNHTGAFPELASDVEKLYITDAELARGNSGRSRRSTTPSSMDWRKQGVIGKIRDQGDCGSCYAFGASDLIAAQNAIERKQGPKTLAAQNIVDCLSDNTACIGGRVGRVLKNVIAHDKGLTLEQCYRYRSSNGSCVKNAPCCLYQKVKWSQIVDITGSQEKEFMARLLHWGPVVAIVDASQAWQFHNGTGVIRSFQCSARQNHAVLLVGYNYENPSSSYYIARNSWSVEWGDKGYAKLEAGTNACGVAQNVATVCAHECDQVKTARDIVLMQR